MGEVATLPASTGEIMERVIALGDLAQLTPEERTTYYLKICQSVGLNALTRPLEYVKLQGKLVLYARKDCADQLRRLHGISIEITDRKIVSDIMMVTARATTADGRIDEDIGAVPVKGLVGEFLANATMKAVTKAKRRVTLSSAGLGFLDETEIEAADETTGHQPRPPAIVPKVEPPRRPPPAKPEPEPINIKVPGGGSVSFARSRHGLENALKMIEEQGAGTALLNFELLDKIAHTMPEYAQQVADIRAAAATELTPADVAAVTGLPDTGDADGTGDEWPGVDAGAEAPEPDDIGRKMAEHKGAAPPDADPFGLPPLNR